MRWIPLLALLSTLDPTLSEPAGPAPASASRPSVHYGLYLTVASSYVFRGELQYDSATVPSFQPAVGLDVEDLGPGTLGFEVWSAIAMAGWDRQVRAGVATEVDLGATYEASLLDDWLELEGGFVYYVYPHAESPDGDKEILVRVGLGNLPVTPSVGLWTAVHPGLGLYVEPRLAFEQTFGSVTFTTDLSMGASIRQGEEAHLDHATLALGLGQEAGPLTFALQACYAIALAPGRGSFLDRSLLYGAVTFGVGR